MLGVALHVGSYGLLQSVERLEIPDFARERVVERWRRLPLHFIERDADGLCLSTLRFVRKIVGPFDRPLDGLAGRGFHDQLLDSRNRLAGTQNERVAFSLTRFCSRRDLHVHHVAGLRLLGDRSPGRLLIADLLDLLNELLFGNRCRGTLDPKPVRPREIDRGPDFEVQLKGERLSLFELQIVDVRLCRDLDALLLHELLVGLANDRLQRFLPDRFAELLPDYGRGRFPGSETGQPDCGGIPLRGLVFRILHHFWGHGDLNVALDPLRSARRKLDLHVRNITELQGPRSATFGRDSERKPRPSCQGQATSALGTAIAFADENQNGDLRQLTFRTETDKWS